jgi:hypothetical protein
MCMPVIENSQIYKFDEHNTGLKSVPSKNQRFGHHLRGSK